jgi:hypothetical protein
MANKVQMMTELWTTAGNEPGTLAKCVHYLREEGINIDAFSAYEKQPGTSAFHFITSDGVRAKECLIKNGYQVDECEVVCWNANNAPGVLYNGTAAMAEKKININYAYATCGPDNTTCWVVFSTGNNTEALNTLNNI